MTIKFVYFYEDKGVKARGEETCVFIDLRSYTASPLPRHPHCAYPTDYRAYPTPATYAVVYTALFSQFFTYF